MTLRPKIALATLVLAAAASRLPAAGLGDYSLTVLVDGAPVPEYGARGRVYIEALKGRTFSLRLTNPTSERVAVALSVDGRNVIDAKRTDAGTATKWILLPGQTAEIPGWQISGDTSRRFFFTETRRSYAKWLGDTANVGTIEAVFYREKRRVAAAAPPPRWMPWLEKKAEAEREASAAPAAPASEEGQGQMTRRDSAAGSLAENRQTQAKAQAKTADSFAATGIGERTAFSVEWVSFDEESSPAARVSLRYEFRPELLRLGVIPREDELYARDRGRGFDREYAPDPYRHR
ncbi:MAG: hypothetical protein ABI592_01005 [Acidobacteriota bacterium]